MSAALSPTQIRRHDAISPTAELIAEARAGRMFILVDDEDRENEGDLIIPAQFATPEALAFMMREARGLICLAMTGQQIDRLELPMMAVANQQRHQTAFTVSIDARAGITTGVSARDRAHSIAVAINPASTPADVVTPGHVFPLLARPGGTLIRAGHTEAAVDLARLAGLLPAGVICEIMNQDGSMARLPDLVGFAQRHGLKLGTIADLIAHRGRTEKLVKRRETGIVPDESGGTWRMIAFEDQIEHIEHVVLVKGDLTTPDPVLVRMHAVDSISDIIGGLHLKTLHGAMAQIREAGRGVVVLIRESKANAVSERIRQLTNGVRPTPALRDYGIGAQILTDLGVRDMVLLSNHKRNIVGLDGYGLNIVEQRGIGMGASE